MTERNFGESVQTWIGIVRNVMDPHQSGRVQVRVFGRHDDVANIPDEDLPWAQVIQPVTSAARGRMGTAPVGLVVGSRVVGIWLDRDNQYPLILGSVGRAGEPIAGQSEGGAPAINTDTGSIPAATQNSAANPYTSLATSRISIADVDSGSYDIDGVTRTEGDVVTERVEEGMQFGTLPTTAAGSESETDVLSLLRQVDPSSSISALPCLPAAATQISLTIDLGSIAAGFIDMLTDAMTRAILNLMEQLGVNAVLAAIDSAAQALANFKSAFDAIQTGGICSAPAALNSISAGTQALARTVANIERARSRISNASARSIGQTLEVTGDVILSRVPTALFRPATLVVTAPTGYVQEYYAYDVDPYPGYIRWVDAVGEGDPVFTLRNGQPNYISAAQHTSYDVTRSLQSALASQIRTGSLNTSSLQSTLAQATGVAQVQALTRVLGSGNPLQILAVGARLIPSIYANVTGIFNARISVTVLPNSGAVQQAVQRFTQAQSLLAVRKARMESAFRRL